MRLIKIPKDIKKGAEVLSLSSKQAIYVNHVITLNQTFFWSFTLSKTEYSVAKIYPDKRMSLTELGSGYISI